MSTIVYLVMALIFWLLPLFWVCQWAERNKKDERMVFLVGILVSWVLALIVALLLPVMSEEQLAQRRHRADQPPGDGFAIMLYGVGVCSLILIGFMAWIKYGI